MSLRNVVEAVVKEIKETSLAQTGSPSIHRWQAVLEAGLLANTEADVSAKHAAIAHALRDCLPRQQPQPEPDFGDGGPRLAEIIDGPAEERGTMVPVGGMPLGAKCNVGEGVYQMQIDGNLHYLGSSG